MSSVSKEKPLGGTSRINRAVQSPVVEGIRRGKRAAEHLAWWLRWGHRPYLSYYQHVADELAGMDPRATVGGFWDVIGPLQLEFLKSEGLQPHHELLDLGCGCLRGGLHFIRYLEPGHYWGTELSEKLLSAGEKYAEEAGLSNREPHLLRSTGFSFSELEGKRFEYILAFGIFPDVPPNLVRECFQSLDKILSPGGQLFATFMQGDEVQCNVRGVKFSYPVSFLKSLANEFGYSAELVKDFRHPRGHRMLRVQRRRLT